MARPIKEGFDYFPLDTMFDEKVQALELVFGNDGLVWLIKFWQSAFKTNNGLVSFDSYYGIIHAGNSKVTQAKHEDIIKFCLETGLIYWDISGKYTSFGIQKRINFLLAGRKKWRKEENNSAKLEQKQVIRVDNYEDNMVDNPIVTPQSKVKESKVNKIKGNKTKENKEVYLSFSECKKLILKYGRKRAYECICYLRNYKNDIGYKNKSDYLSILRWVYEAVDKKLSKGKINFPNFPDPLMFKRLSDLPEMTSDFKKHLQKNGWAEERNKYTQQNQWVKKDKN